MIDINERLDQKDWLAFNNEMHEQGFSIVRNVLSESECDFLKSIYTEEQYFRKTISMERYRFGKGEYKYFTYPLPEILDTLRHRFFEQLSPIANQWMEQLNINRNYPDNLDDFLSLCHDSGQDKATLLILKYKKGGYNTMHQDLYGEIFFPMQIVISLDQADADYTGGEFIISEQIPRAQSRVNVLRPNKGDILAFTTNFRPMKGSRGYYRVNMKHGVGTVHEGTRHTLGIIFHDAK